MKRLFKTLAIVAVCGALVVPVAEAQSRGNRPSSGTTRGNVGSGGGRVSTPTSRPTVSPNTQTRPSTGKGNIDQARPGGNVGTPRPNVTKPSGPTHGNNPGAINPGNNGSNRPGNPGAVNPGNNGGNRPGNPGAVNPGNNGGNRPGNPGAVNPGNNGGNRPNNPGGNFGHGSMNGGHRPGGGAPNQWGNPGPRPGNPGVRPHPQTPPPPYRPYYHNPWQPPRPPMGWRPGPYVPTFSTILGITFGTALNLSLDLLLNNGYTVYSYGTNVVYLSNVNQLNLFWPDAELYFTNGGLSRGEFIYATPYYDTNRYNTAYSRLVSAYGAPVATAYPSNGMQTTWFGNGGRFITLTYQPMFGADGISRYYTTLSFGF